MVRSTYKDKVQCALNIAKNKSKIRKFQDHVTIMERNGMVSLVATDGFVLANYSLWPGVGGEPFLVSSQNLSDAISRGDEHFRESLPSLKCDGPCLTESRVQGCLPRPTDFSFVVETKRLIEWCRLAKNLATGTSLPQLIIAADAEKFAIIALLRGEYTVGEEEGAPVLLWEGDHKYYGVQNHDRMANPVLFAFRPEKLLKGLAIDCQFSRIFVPDSGGKSLTVALTRYIDEQFFTDAGAFVATDFACVALSSTSVTVDTWRALSRQNERERVSQLNSLAMAIESWR